MRANYSGHFPLEIRVRPLPEHDFPNVIPDVEIWIWLPSGQAYVEGRKHRTLCVTRDEMQLRFDKA
jgi:hypothetical protein